MIIEVHRIAIHDVDDHTRRLLHDIIADSYCHPEILLNRAFSVNSDVYVGIDNDSRRPSCCFFANHDYTFEDLGAGNRSTLHLGLSGATSEAKRKGAILSLYRRCLIDANTIDSIPRGSRLLWGLTTNPFVFRTVHRFCIDVSPQLDGGYSPQALQLAQLIRARLECPAEPDDHPFVFRKPLPGFDYLPHEAEKIEEMMHKRGYPIFASCRTSHCDHVLFVARLPAHLPNVRPNDIATDIS